MSEREETDRGVQVAGCCFLVVVAIIAAVILLFVFLFAPFAASAEPVTTDPKVARQHTNDACLLGAIATAMNYKSGGVNYTSAGLALAYKLKYHAENWAQDGNTSHQAQALAGDAGFKVHYGRLTVKDNGTPDNGVEALKYLAWAKHYPVVFLSGSPQHALTVLALLNETTLLIADPLDGRIYQESPESLYRKLENQKWYFALD